MTVTIHPIVVLGEPVLHRRADEVRTFDSELRRLVDDMFETLTASNGVGLAAPQIGIGLRIFVYDAPDDDGEEHRGVFVNPQLVGTKIPGTPPDKDEESEGCLSVPSLDFPLKRAEWVKVTGFDAEGEPQELEARGWFARIMQHEYDHLDGKLYVDRLNDKWSRKAKKLIKAKAWGVPGNSWLPGTDPDPFGH